MSELRPLTIAFCNLKGGVGKSTLAIHCAQAWARRLGDGKVQLVDRDKGNSDVANFIHNMPEVLAEGDGNPVLRVLDTPPQAVVALKKSLREARYVVVPVMGAGAARGLVRLVRHVETEKDKAGRVIQTRYVLTMTDRTNSTKELDREMRLFFGGDVLESSVRRADVYEQASRACKSVFDVAPKHPATADMQTVCDELYERFNLKILE